MISSSSMREVARQQREAADLLLPVEVLVEAVDLALDKCAHSGRSHRARRAIRTRCRAPWHRARASRSSGRCSADEELAAVADDAPACRCSGELFSAFSIGCGAMFLPPAVMIRSFLRSVICRKPSASISPMSPVWNQPSGSIASAVASGLL